ncbi:MAG: caspase family protein [Bacteroides sp.]|nr:caspase family protein [Bacteroides sp.]
MKKFITTLVLILGITLGCQARTFVLIAGISNYGNANNNLCQTTKDAKRFKSLMETQTKDITILTSKNVTRINLLEKLRAICKRAQENDRIVFFYSGHGSPGAMCGYDGNIPYEDVIKTLSQSAAKEKICFIDACFSGSMSEAINGDQSWMSNATSSGDILLMVACRPDEFSYESPMVGAGYFTQALLKGMCGKSDVNADKNITVEELFRYVYGDVIKRTKGVQHPQLIGPKGFYNKIVTKW